METYNGLFFDTIIASSRVYMKCEGPASCSSTNRLAFCSSCISKNKYIFFATVQPFDFELVQATRLFSDFYPKFNNRPVTTLEICAAYMGAIEYFDELFDPEKPFMDKSEKWNEDAFDHRKLAWQMWSEEEDAFSQELMSITPENGKNMLDLICLLERRIVLGDSICQFVNTMAGKDLAKKEWIENARKIIENLGSICLVPWTTNRCKSDKVEEWQNVLQEWNRAKRLAREKYDEEHQEK
jgi:hypothetical protein